MLNNLQFHSADDTMEYFPPWFPMESEPDLQQPPAQILDLVNAENRAHIHSAKPNKLIYVIVVPATGSKKAVKTGIGRRSDDGESFSVDMEINREIHTHTWSWKELISAIHACRSTDCAFA